MSMLRILSSQGDDRRTWDQLQAQTGDPETLAAIQEAERIFAEVRARGGSAFEVRKGQLAVRIETFNPEAEQIIMIPQVAGG